MNNLEDFVIPGKINMVIDGQFGSTGKGLLASAIANCNHVDIAIGRLSPNAGHTFYIDNKKYVTKMLPVAGIMQRRSTIYLSAGSVIDVDILLKELKEFDIDEDRVIIHPRAAIVTAEDKELESKKDGVKKIASTQSGSGSARASKIMRKNPLAAKDKRLEHMISHDYILKDILENDLCCLVETGQGFDLGLNFGLDYPHCTSIDVIPSSILADIGMHPTDLGNTAMCVRTYPIRVGNIVENNEVIGYSGDVYPDSKELTWEELNQIPELTTVTKRIRRIFTFSIIQYKRALFYIRPDLVFLNFINYCKLPDVAYEDWFKKMVNVRKPEFVGKGPNIEDVIPFDEYFGKL